MTIRNRRAPMRGASARSDAGVTLIELLIVVSLMSVVMAAAYLLFGSANAMSEQLEARASAYDENRKLMNQLTRELRQAVEITDDGGAFATAQARLTQFYSDVDADGAPEKVKYAVVNGAIIRTVYEPTTQVAPYTFNTTPSSTATVVKALDGTWTGDIFTYYDRQDPPAVISASHPEDASAVALRIVNTATVNHRTAAVDFSTWVKIRSIHNSID